MESTRQAIREAFSATTDAILVYRIDTHDNYDDEAVELTRRLGEAGLAWMFGPGDKVKIYDPETGDDFIAWSGGSPDASEVTFEDGDA